MRPAVGISPEMRPFFFDRFRQADSTMMRGHGGLALGLAIVRQLVELRGGTVQASSAGAGRGAEFVVRRPAARPPREPGIRVRRCVAADTASPTADGERLPVR